MLSISNATITDIPIIRDITAEVWPPTYVPIIGEQQVAYMIGLFYAPEELKKQMSSGHRFIICYSDGLPVGFASWSEIATRIFKLHKIYILTGQQGKGIGKAMIAHVVSEIRKEAATALRLNVNRYNSSAIAFYERMGFAHYLDEDIDIGNGFFMNDHVLELPV
jgi:ribosomal protein S18 acetylase RimI-like enzyme